MIDRYMSQWRSLAPWKVSPGWFGITVRASVPAVSQRASVRWYSDLNVPIGHELLASLIARLQINRSGAIAGSSIPAESAVVTPRLFCDIAMPDWPQLLI